MYDKGIVALGGVSTVAFLAPSVTQVMWWFLGGFAVLAASLALFRILPRRKA